MTLLLSNLKVPYLSLKKTFIIAGCHYFSVMSWCYPWIWILLLQWTSDVRLTDHLLHVLYLFSSYSLLSFIFPSTLMSKLFLFFVFYLSLSECLWRNDVQSLYYLYFGKWVFLAFSSDTLVCLDPFWFTNFHCGKNKIGWCAQAVFVNEAHWLCDWHYQANMLETLTWASYSKLVIAGRIWQVFMGTYCTLTSAAQAANAFSFQMCQHLKGNKQVFQWYEIYRQEAFLQQRSNRPKVYIHYNNHFKMLWYDTLWQSDFPLISQLIFQMYMYIQVCYKRFVNAI